MCVNFMLSPPVCGIKKLIDATSFLTLSYGLFLRKDSSNIEVTYVSAYAFFQSEISSTVMRKRVSVACYT